MKISFLLSHACWLVALLISGSVCSAASSGQPNVVFILADDLGVNDLAVYGSRFHETPNMDSLARRGMRFTQASSTSPLCSPTRSSIMTGLHPAHTGITSAQCHFAEVVLEKKLQQAAPADQRMLASQSVTRLESRYFTLAEAFRQNGYTTAHFGKWHLGANPFSPLEHGFETDIPHTSAPGPLPNGFFHPFHVWKGHGKTGDHLEDQLCDEAVRFIEQHSSQPFFLNYWAFEVHSPWQAKASQIDKFRRKADPASLQRNPVYASMIESLDLAVGRIIAALERTGQIDRSIIIFTSDNGPVVTATREHMPEEFHSVPVSSAMPLRGGKSTIYEGGTRVPLLVVWPGTVKAGSVSDALFQSTDFFPTLAAMLGWKLPDDVHFDGVDQQQALLGGAPTRDEIFCHFPHPQPSLVYERIPAPTPKAPASTMRHGDWKLIRLYGGGPGHTDRHELYNLATDPGEKTDLIAQHPEQASRLTALLDQRLKSMGAVIPTPNPGLKNNPAPRKP